MKRMADCHPDRPHKALGLCDPCYQVQYRRNRMETDPEYAERVRSRHNTYLRDRRQNDPEFLENNHRVDLKRRYNLSPEDYLAMLDSQDGKCKICGKTITDNGKRLSVDHDHVSGQVRGLLCDACNTGLGKFQDNPEILRIASEYLLENK